MVGILNGLEDRLRSDPDAFFDFWCGERSLTRLMAYSQRSMTIAQADPEMDRQLVFSWKKLGLLPFQSKSGDGKVWNRFSPIEVCWIKVIKSLRTSGMPIDHIRKLKERLFYEVHDKPALVRIQFSMFSCLVMSILSFGSTYVLFSDRNGDADVIDLNAMSQGNAFDILSKETLTTLNLKKIVESVFVDETGNSMGFVLEILTKRLRSESDQVRRSMESQLNDILKNMKE